MKFKIREKVNSLTHLIGAAVALLGLILLIRKAIDSSVPPKILVGVIVFGLSLIALYTTSGIYHMLVVPQKILLRLKKLDHSMIFVLIAGTFTPILLTTLNGPWQTYSLILIWSIALGGVLFKIFWIQAPRWLYTGIYLGMGWMGALLVGAVYQRAGIGGLLFLILGGLSYSVGAVIYGLKKPNFSKEFGFHEFFHCFDLLGSLFHYFLVYLFLI